MALWNNLGKMASGATTKAVEQAKILAEVTKLNSQIADEEKKITDNYTQLGKLYIELHSTNCEKAFLGMVSTIQESERKIDALKSQIQDIKGIVRCSKCGAELPKDAQFCNSCGNRVEPKKQELSNAEHTPKAAAYCSVCGSEVTDDALFCGTCGNRIHAAKATEEIISPTKSVESHPVAAEVPLTSPTPSFAQPPEESSVSNGDAGGVADSEIQPLSNAYPAQGEPDSVENSPKAEETASSAIAERVNLPAPARRFCMNCGSEIRSNDTFCAECGSPIE